MSQQATATKEKILHSAQEQFLLHGFTGASLRTIAAGAGVTTGALYRHFADKSALFAALVAPCVDQLVSMYNTAADQFIRNLDDVGLDWSSSEENVYLWVEFIYSHLDTFKLLLLAAEKTDYENFTHMLVDMEVETTLAYVQRAINKGFPVHNVNQDEVHMFVSAQFSVLFEMVHHQLTYEQAKEFARSINRFFTAGWLALFLKE